MHMAETGAPPHGIYCQFLSWYVYLPDQTRSCPVSSATYSPVKGARECTLSHRYHSDQQGIQFSKSSKAVNWSPFTDCTEKTASGKLEKRKKARRLSSSGQVSGHSAYFLLYSLFIRFIAFFKASVTACREVPSCFATSLCCRPRTTHSITTKR